MHCAQSGNEFNEMVSRHGKTPVQFAHDLGILAARTILGHAIFIDEHSWVQWHSHADLQILAKTRTSIAHCPSPFARYGQTLEDFGRYRRAGVNIGLGTDVRPAQPDRGDAPCRCAGARRGTGYHNNERHRGEGHRRSGGRLNNLPGLAGTLGSVRSAAARHEADEGRHGAWKRKHKRPGMRMRKS